MLLGTLGAWSDYVKKNRHIPVSIETGVFDV